MFCHDARNFELSPRFASALVEGGTGVGLLQRAQEEVTRRAHQLWLETGRADDKANWEDAERTLVHWRRLHEDLPVPEEPADSWDTTSQSSFCLAYEKMALEDMEVDYVNVSREELMDLCVALQVNLRQAKTALGEERSAVKALRTELRGDERSRSQHLSAKLIAAERRCMEKSPCGRAGRIDIPALPLSLDKVRQVEHFDLTPRARTRKRALRCASSTSGSDCEACEIQSAAEKDGSPRELWWYSTDFEQDTDLCMLHHESSTMEPESSDCVCYATSMRCTINQEGGMVYFQDSESEDDYVWHPGHGGGTPPHRGSKDDMEFFFPSAE
ncbi:unnamed protein product [Effrenium voratum]|uniref:Uncharacterized protein n=1 Tax=Effrenium voratum TaxID=2562239 RepID=A0AA36I0K7_9DINO|nr:unnamed protein product [Effrenium voratum]